MSNRFVSRALRRGFCRFVVFNNQSSGRVVFTCSQCPNPLLGSDCPERSRTRDAFRTDQPELIRPSTPPSRLRPVGDDCANVKFALAGCVCTRPGQCIQCLTNSPVKENHPTRMEVRYASPTHPVTLHLRYLHCPPAIFISISLEGWRTLPGWCTRLAWVTPADTD